MQFGEERECLMSGFDLFRESKRFETTIGPKKNKVIAKQVEARAEQSDGKSGFTSAGGSREQETAAVARDAGRVNCVLTPAL